MTTAGSDAGVTRSPNDRKSQIYCTRLSKMQIRRRTWPLCYVLATGDFGHAHTINNQTTSTRHHDTDKTDGVRRRDASHLLAVLLVSVVRECERGRGHGGLVRQQRVRVQHDATRPLPIRRRAGEPLPIPRAIRPPGQG